MADDPGRRFPTKHKRIYDDLRQSLRDGRFADGDKLPTEQELAETYGVSRPTASKALDRLKKEGLITRRTGSGSFASVAQQVSGRHRMLGLLVPSLGTGEIFEPICAQIAALSEANDFSLLWGGMSQGQQASSEEFRKVVQRFIHDEVEGIFFAPVELRPEFGEMNRQTVAMLEKAGIPIVLIDTDYNPLNRRSAHDLVGIDNLQGGYIATERFLGNGCGPVDFFYVPYSSYTLQLRKIGYHAAMRDYGYAVEESRVHCGFPENREFVAKDILGTGARSIVCGNDRTAAALMNTLDALGKKVPDDVRLIGFDDVFYARHLKVPLTTVRQPCKDIGSLAVRAMMDRIADPLAKPVTIQLQGKLIVRESCGTRAAGE